MSVALGIDTGGTYTDAVLVDQPTGAILASAKALTTHCDLSLGIAESIRAVFAAAADQGQPLAPTAVEMVGLSTTLATNAIVEDRGAPICLILVGYDPDLIRDRGFERELVTREVVYVRGGHDGQGEEVSPLDEEEVRRAVLARRDRVKGFAVSSYFGVRNPAHELRVRDLVETLTGLPVTCGHELTSRLDSIRRATTTALNARLIPLLRELIAAVRRTLDGEGIAAPLMIVKGDGSLVRSEWAWQRPIETILSGPAASAIGAWHLAGRQDAWVIDVGGTTTDIARLHRGLPRLNLEGARVGRWRTMIETVDVHTVGLGGDSQVRMKAGTRSLEIGPRRAVPLCQLASAHPQVIDELQRQLAAREYLSLSGQFVLPLHHSPTLLDHRSRELLAHLDSAPCSLLSLAQRVSYGLLVLHPLEELERSQIVQRAGFTPTDALHVLGRFQRWNREAACLGAELLALQAGLSVEDFCEQVVAEFSRRLVAELVGKALADEGKAPTWDREPAAAALLDRALGQSPDSALACTLALRQPLVAVGAPVEAYLPQVAEDLHTPLVIPAYAEVANAIGAVVNSVVQRLRVLIRPQALGFRFHLPGEVRDFADLEEGVAYARQVVIPRLQELARQAGAPQTEVQMIRQDRTAPDGYGGSGEIFVETELIFTAVGSPGRRSLAS